MIPSDPAALRRSELRARTPGRLRVRCVPKDLEAGVPPARGTRRCKEDVCALRPVVQQRACAAQRGEHRERRAEEFLKLDGRDQRAHARVSHRPTPFFCELDRCSASVVAAVAGRAEARRCPLRVEGHTRCMCPSCARPAASPAAP